MNSPLPAVQAPGEASKRYEVGGRGAYAILAVTTLLFIVNWMDRQVLAVVIEPMKKDLGFSDAQIASLQTFFMISVGACALPIGLLVDRWSRRKMIALLAIAWSVATFLTGLVSQLFMLWIVMFLVGVGEAGYKPGGAGWLSVAFPREKRSMAIGILDLGIPIGAALGMVCGGLLVTRTGNWRIPFFTFAVPGIVLAIVTLFLPDYATVKEKDESILSRAFLSEAIRIIKIKSVLYTTLGSSAYTFAMIGFLAWMPAFYMRAFKLTEASVGYIAALLVVSGSAGMVIGGWLGDVWQQRNQRGRALACVVFGALTVVVRSLYLWSFYSGSLKVAIAVGLIDSFLVMGYNPLSETMVQDPVTPRHRATSMGIFLCVNFVLGGAWGPLTVGAISDHLGSGFTGLHTAFWMILPIGLLCPFFQLLAVRHYIPDTAGVVDEALAEK